MNPWLLAAAALALAVGLAHSYLGERFIIQPLLRRDPPVFADVFRRRVLRFAWHITSIAWWGFAALFLALPEGDHRVIGTVSAVTFGISSLVTLAASRGRHLAWPVFLAIALFSWIGTR